jgi:hypothetical protein
VEIPAGGEDEQGAANRGVSLGIVYLDSLTREVCENDQLDVSRSGTRLRSSPA